MALTVEQGQVEVGRILREMAEEQGVEIHHVDWWTQAGEVEPSYYNLTVHTVSEHGEKTRFSPRNLTALDSDNEMKMQVRAKIEGVVVQLKKYER
ncbi:MAG: hypothetical protein ACYSYT_06430 [Planctomycetota bacterium]|jgi:hypothetical protein